MAKNMMGLGFAFGGKNAGLTQVAAKVAGAIGSVAGAAAGLKEKFGRPLADAKNGLLAFKAALPENLTTSLEGQFVSFSKAAHAQAFQLGYGVKQMDKFSKEASNLGYSLNTSTEAAGKAIFAWDRGSDVLKAIGVDSKETALKLQEVSGIDMGQFVLQLQSAKKSLGLTDDQLKRLTNSTVAWGQQSGDVNKALAGMQDQFAHLKDRAHAFGRTLSGEELTDWAEKTNQAKQLMMALGSTTEDAEEGAKGLADTLLKQGKNMGQMFAGTSNDLTEFQQSFAVAGVDIKKQFALMKGGPVGFIQGMSEMVEQSRKAGKLTDQSMNFVKRQLEQGLGDPKLAQQIFNVFQQGGTAVTDLVKKLPKASEDVGTLAKKAYQTGLTWSDLMERQHQGFMMQLRAGAMVTETVTVNGKEVQRQIPLQKQYFEQSKKGYADMAKNLNKLAGEKGLLGAMARKVRDIQVIGFAGILPESLRGYVPVLETLGKEFGPILGSVSQMVPLLMLLPKLFGGLFSVMKLGFAVATNPVFLIIAAIGLLVFWFMKARKEGDTFGQTVSRMEDQMIGFFDNIESWLVEKFPKHTKTIHAVIEGLKIAFGALAEFVKAAVDGWEKFFDFIESSLNGETNSLSDFGETVHDIWKYEIVDPIKLYFQNLWLDLKKGASDAMDTVSGIFKSAVDFVTLPFRKIDEWVDKLFRHSISSDIKDDLDVAFKFFDKFTGTISRGLSTLLAPISGLFPSASPAATGGTAALPPPIRPPPTVSAADRDAGLIAAVHQPAWYARYEQVFMQRMMALEAAVSGSAPPKGGRTSIPVSSGAGQRGLNSDLGTNKYFAVDKSGLPTKAGGG